MFLGKSWRAVAFSIVIREIVMDKSPVVVSKIAMTLISFSLFFIFVFIIPVIMFPIILLLYPSLLPLPFPLHEGFHRHTCSTITISIKISTKLIGKEKRFIINFLLMQKVQF